MRHAAVFLPSPPAAASEPPEPAEEVRYARSGMTAAAADEIGQRLERRAGQQRDFLEPDLTLAELSQRLGTSPQLLSQYLNEVLGATFYDYVNGLRVAEVQRLMRDPARREASLLDLSLAAGFNSRSTFNAAFKKATGMPPSQWRKQAGAVSEPIGQDDKQPA
jgi:AraC-like DNA-binding protein